MTTFTLKYIKRTTDRHGHLRHYYNRPGYPRTAIPGKPGSREFMDAYNAVHNGTAPKIRPGQSRIKPGTVNDLITRFYQSTQFADLKPATRTNYRTFYERFRSTTVPAGGTIGDAMVKDFRVAHIAKYIDGLKDTPGAARNMRNRLRTLFAYAVIPCEFREDNPVREVKAPKPKSRDGFTPWTDADIEAFKTHYPLGTKPYLALMLLLRTAVRRSDAHKMGRQHLVATDRGNELHFRAQKGDKDMIIPVDAELQAALDLVPKTQMIFIQTEYGKPFSADGFTHWFVKKAKAAGLTGKSPHGLRKAADRHMAESDATPHEIAAVDGHSSLAEVERYTRSVNKRNLAWKAIEKRNVGRVESGG